MCGSGNDSDVDNVYNSVDVIAARGGNDNGGGRGDGMRACGDDGSSGWSPWSSVRGHSRGDHSFLSQMTAIVWGGGVSLPLL